MNGVLVRHDLTLLVCTHGRPEFLQRSLLYYAGLEVDLIVLDSSAVSSADSCAPYANVQYVHCPELGYQGFKDKLKKGVSLVRTPYMVFVSDDDFVLHDAFADSVEFLKNNPDYGVCHGYCLMYLPEADRVHYFLRDKKVVEDFSSDVPGERLLSFMANYIPPWYAVSRTDIIKAWYDEIPDEMGMEFQEFGHAFYLLIRAKAKILNRPYVIREINYPVSDHSTDLLAALVAESGGLSQERERFRDFMSPLLEGMDFPSSVANRLIGGAIESLATCLANQHSLTAKEIFHSEWAVFSSNPAWRFEPEQFVEMPFYNRHFFNVLEVLDLLMRVRPVGKLQVSQLKDVLVEQDALLEEGASVDPQDPGFRTRLETAFGKNPFHPELASLFARITESADLAAWSRLLAGATQVGNKFARLAAEHEGGRPRHASVDNIQQWLSHRQVTAVQRDLIARYLNEQKTVRITVYVLDLAGDSDGLMKTIKSLVGDDQLQVMLNIVVLTMADAPRTQIGDKLHFVRIASRNPVELLNELVADGTCDWLMLVRAGEVFTASGLMMAVLELAGVPDDCRAVYGDELQRLPDGSLGAVFRPDFNLDMLLSMPATLSRHWLYRRDCLIAAGGFDAQYDEALEFELLLRLLEQGGMVGLGHISEPLVISAASPLADNAQELSAITRHLARRGYENGTVREGLPGRYRINYGHPAQPLVSIIIPTKDQLPILQRCVESLLEKTTYTHYELLIVDNASETPEAKAWLAGVESMGEEKVRVLRYPHPFNYSAINNMAAREARGEYLVLLNNDTAVISESWLDELLNHAQRPEVGIVGAKLLYPDARIQHAGVLLGLRGPADHPFIGEAIDATGYMHRLQVDQNYSAVTAACLMIRKDIYEEVGGLDEARFKVSYNDIDLCLKVRELGYLTVWTPHAVVLHEGSVSQTKVDTNAQEAKRKRFAAEQDAMYEKWLPVLAADPAYNRNLSLSGPGFELETDPGLTWRPLSWRPVPVVLAHPADPWGCGNYRVIKPFQALQREGKVDGLLSEGLLQVVDLQRFDPDVLVLQRQLGEERLEAMSRIKAFSRAFKVYELDDYLPNLPIKSLHREHMPRDVLKSLRRGLSFVDRFVVSTAPLADAFSGLHDNIRVIENRLPVEWWKGLNSQRRRGRKPRVGWAGGVSHTGDLELIADVVKELASEVEWVFFGMCPEKIRPYVHEVHRGVDIDLYPAALAALDLDLALAPVERNLFNECKSNLRLLEYGACGFPVVCSDLLCYQGDLPVTRVKNRFKDWVDAIRAHIHDLDATARMGDELRSQVYCDWMLEGTNVDAWRKAWLPD